MPATAKQIRRKSPIGSPRPRVAPPTPARTGVKEFIATAESIGLDLWPWQREAARYLTAMGQGDRWLYREVAVIVARQNGKTELLLPLIVQRLLEGKRVMHTAQNRELPRELHRRLGALLLQHHPRELVPRGIRYGAGQEEIRLLNGGHYRIVAPTTGGARGASNDLVIIDELREMVDHDFIAAAKPTTAAAPNPQIVYLSNAGKADSEVLNALKARAGSDPKLAYLEWSAAPDRAPDELDGWLEANPSIGHSPGLLENLEDDYRADLLGGTMANFETEHLCRWVVSMAQKLVSEENWNRTAGDVGKPTRTVMGVSVDGDGTRATAVVAWADGDKVSASVVANVTGDPVDVDRLGPELRSLAARLRVSEVGFDPWTDADLARHFRVAKPVNGRSYANASGKFVQLVEGGNLTVKDDEKLIGEDLKYAAKRPTAFGSFMAVKADNEHSVTGLLALIRAVWLASGPKPTMARIY